METDYLMIRTIQISGKEHAENFTCVWYQEHVKCRPSAPVVSPLPLPTSCAKAAKHHLKWLSRKGVLHVRPHAEQIAKFTLIFYWEKNCLPLFLWEENTNHKTNLSWAINYSPFRDYELTFFPALYAPMHTFVQRNMMFKMLQLAHKESWSMPFNCSERETHLNLPLKSTLYILIVKSWF